MSAVPDIAAFPHFRTANEVLLMGFSGILSKSFLRRLNDAVKTLPYELLSKVFKG